MIAPELLADGLAFPEGPRWHDGALWLSDVSGGKVLRIGDDCRPMVVADIGDRPSGLGFLPDGSLLVVSVNRRELWRVVDGTAACYADLSQFGGDFLNDMVVDGDGRAYIGVRSTALKPGFVMPDGDAAPDAVLAVEPDGRAQVAAAHLVSPNGSVITPAGDEFIIAETYAHRLMVYDRARDGALDNRRVFADVGQAYPDGICLDADGAVWIGSPYTGEFLRVRRGGEVTDRIPMPGGVACMLGGADGRTLFLLAVDPTALPTPGVATNPDVLHGARVYDGGRVFTVRVECERAGWP